MDPACAFCKKFEDFPTAEKLLIRYKENHKREVTVVYERVEAMLIRWGTYTPTSVEWDILEPHRASLEAKGYILGTSKYGSLTISLPLEPAPS